MKPLLAVIVFFVQVKCSEQALFIQGNAGALKIRNFHHLHRHRLKVAPVKTIELEKEMQCVTTCVKKKDCLSLNVKKTTIGKFLCEMLNETKFQNPDNLTKDDGYVHWYLPDPCVSLPCWYNGRCAPSITSSQTNCECLPKFNGNDCQFDVERNYALGKPTSQSSTMGSSTLAVDGNRAPGFCMHTDSHPLPHWWRVDMEDEIPVARVVISTRVDCCWKRLSDFEIKIGNSLEDEGMKNPKCGHRHSITTGGPTAITCIPPVSGRYLTLQSFLTDFLNFCELEVYTK